ncbi:protein lifeguard 3-like isoform X2 [Onthophagus taurus]|uniref:protein lifeguard 3-like isoform X2 n=1 Tax=Onthophagus taurus TaxID=166361 RepID=UPI000C2009D0|nr:protein lifeguard 3-like isoform X2 [Onthophagus taurus]
MYKLGLFGGGERNDGRYMVGGKPVYYDGGHVPPINAARTPAVQPGRRPEYEDSVDSYENEFTSRAIRHAFIKKVYFLLFMQLGFTAAVIALFQFEPNCNLFARRYFFVSIIFLMVSLIFYMVLVCVQAARRNYPLNFILFAIYTIISAIGYALLAALYAPDIVLYSFGITAAVCLAVTILAMQKCIDITGCGMYLCLIGLVISLFGLATMITMMIMGWNETTRILYLVYASIAAILCL